MAIKEELSPYNFIYKNINLYMNTNPPGCLLFATDFEPYAPCRVNALFSRVTPEYLSNGCANHQECPAVPLTVLLAANFCGDGCSGGKKHGSEILPQGQVTHQGVRGGDIDGRHDLAGKIPHRGSDGGGEI